MPTSLACASADADADPDPEPAEEVLVDEWAVRGEGAAPAAPPGPGRRQDELGSKGVSGLGRRLFSVRREALTDESLSLCSAAAASRTFFCARGHVRSWRGASEPTDARVMAIIEGGTSPRLEGGARFSRSSSGTTRAADAVFARACPGSIVSLRSSMLIAEAACSTCPSSLYGARVTVVPLACCCCCCTAPPEAPWSETHLVDAPNALDDGDGVECTCTCTWTEASSAAGASDASRRTVRCRVASACPSGRPAESPGAARWSCVRDE